MELREFFSEDAIKLELEGDTKDDVLRELIGLLKLDEKSEGMLYKMLKRRENLGSTGIGRGIAIPHCRSLVVNKLRVAFGRKTGGVDFKAIDERPVNFFFLIVAPPLEVSNQYLPVLGRIAQFAKEPDVAERLAGLGEPREFLSLRGEGSVAMHQNLETLLEIQDLKTQRRELAEAGEREVQEQVFGLSVDDALREIDA